MSKVKLSISVEDDHLSQFDEVVEQIRKAGMNVEQKLQGVGVITGSIDESKINALHKVKGVAHVEQEREVHIAPPGSKIQ